MAVLICRPVSRHSRPDKIERWISRLQQMRQQHRGQPETIELIDRLLQQARSWTRARAANPTAPATSAGHAAN